MSEISNRDQNFSYNTELYFLLQNSFIFDPKFYSLYIMPPQKCRYHKNIQQKIVLLAEKSFFG